MLQDNIFINQTNFNENSLPSLYAEGSELAEPWEDIDTGQQHFCSPNKKPTSDSESFFHCYSQWTAMLFLCINTQTTKRAATTPETAIDEAAASSNKKQYKYLLDLGF